MATARLGTSSPPCPPTSSPASALVYSGRLPSHFLNRSNFSFLLHFDSAPLKKKISFVSHLNCRLRPQTAHSEPTAERGRSRAGCGPRRRGALRELRVQRARFGLGRFPLSSCLEAGWSSFSSEGPESRGAAVEPGKAAMERGSRRRSRGGARSALRPAAASRPAASRPPASRPPASRSAEPPGAQLWLFPSAAGLRSALPRRTEATRQMCCTRGRLAVLERGGAGVAVHQLPAGSDGARKPSEWGRAAPAPSFRLGWGCEDGGWSWGPHGRFCPEGPELWVCSPPLNGKEGSEGTRGRSSPRWPQKRAGRRWFSRLARAASLSSPLSRLLVGAELAGRQREIHRRLLRLPRGGRRCPGSIFILASLPLSLVSVPRLVFHLLLVRTYLLRFCEPLENRVILFSVIISYICKQFKQTVALLQGGHLRRD